VSDCAGRQAAALSALWEMRRIWQAASAILGHLNAADSLSCLRHLVGPVPERLRENRVKVPTRLLVGAMVLICVANASTIRSTQAADEKPLELGNFSVSLAVKDIKASMAFYQKLDFKQVGGNLEQKWVVLQNGTARIGLFQGMFEKNILTFNPGWTKNKETLTDFQDVRELQRALKARGLTIAPEVDVTTKGPAYFEVTDPDGNTLLIDQHVPSPSR
jgi:predicted enzyme related to lactoylglutathione lyase